MDLNILGYRINLEVLILMGVLYLVLMCTLVGGCCHVKRSEAEGFRPLGDMMDFNASSGSGPSTWGTSQFRGPEGERWGVPSMSVINGQPISKDVQAVIDRPSGLDVNNLDIFAKTRFTPDACATSGSSYSSSTGCAVLSPSDYNLHVTRGGGNRYSEY